MSDETPMPEERSPGRRLAGQPLRVWLLLAALVSGLFLSGWLGWRVAMSSERLQDYQRLLDERAGSQQQLEESRQRQQQLEVDLLVALQTLADSQTLVADLEQQVFRLQQDLAQYQGALDPRAMAQGVRIQTFELQPADRPGVFRYKVMVSRVGSESDTVQARLQLTLQGWQEGAAATYALDELTDNRSEYVPLDFRYFQVVPGAEGGELVLPPGFVPELIVLTVERDGKVLLEQSHRWEDAVLK